VPSKWCICPGCPACPPGKRSHLFDAATSPGHNRCAPCQDQVRQADNRRPRASTAARGYGASHQRRAKELLAAATVCAYCGQPPTPSDPLVACHVYAQSRGGPQDGPLAAGHRSCNSRAAGRLRKRKR
jgi:hypothetical protein